MFIGVIAAVFPGVAAARVDPRLRLLHRHARRRRRRRTDHGHRPDRRQVGSGRAEFAVDHRGQCAGDDGVAWSVLYILFGGVGTIVLDQTSSILLTLALTVSIVNAMNFVDGLDGLAAGWA